MKQYNIMILVATCVLVACGGHPAKQMSTESQSLASQSSSVRATPMQVAKQTMEERFLEQAEEAFRLGRLITPAEHNAYDSFHSVLLLNPNNQQARSGLQAILIRFADDARKAMAASRFGQANSILRQAQVFYPGSSLLLDLQRDLREMQNRYEQTTLSKPTDDLTVQEFPLPRAMLSDRNEKLLPFIASIAQRIKDTDESVMIYARTDGEGRWIYKLMRDSVPGYRVRGDIRLAKDPRIAILPPL